MAKRQAVKARKLRKKTGGPYLAAAFFCESLIEDKADGALTAVRIIDSMVVQLGPDAAPDFPSDENRLPIQIHALLTFKSGDSPGNHAIKVVAESPSGKRQTILEQTLPLSPPPHGGANLRVSQTIGVHKGGLFWTHVFLDGKRVTSMPLQISIERVASPLSNAANN